MVCYSLSNAGGIGGRGRIATAEEIENMHDITQNYFSGGPMFWPPTNRLT